MRHRWNISGLNGGSNAAAMIDVFLFFVIIHSRQHLETFFHWKKMYIKSRKILCKKFSTRNSSNQQGIENIAWLAFPFRMTNHFWHVYKYPWRKLRSSHRFDRLINHCLTSHCHNKSLGSWDILVRRNQEKRIKLDSEYFQKHLCFIQNCIFISVL